MLRKLAVFIFFGLFAASALSQNKLVAEQSLLMLNNATLSAYAKAKNKEFNTLDPIMIAIEDHLAFYYRGKRQQYSIIPQEYTQLKTYSQLTLGIFALYHKVKVLPTKDLQGYRSKIIEAQKVLSHTSLTAAQQQRQKQIIQHTLSLIDSSLHDGKINVANFYTYFSKAMPLIWQNVNEAAIAQLRLVDQQVLTIKKNMTEAEWKSLKVVVVGPHLPRKDNLLMQYFASLLQVNPNNDRLVYGEALSTEQQALDLMARVSLDTTLGEIVFNDKFRMYRDLLGDPAKTYLHQLFSKKAIEQKKVNS